MKSFHHAVVASVTLLATMTTVAQPGGGFNRLDSDGDGRVSAEEFAARPGPGPRFFDEADGDDDGALTREELQGAIDAAAEARGRAGTQMLQRFDTIDTDGDGRITRAEAEGYAFTRADRDGDGFISEDEARSMHDKRRGWRDRRDERG